MIDPMLVAQEIQDASIRFPTIEGAWSEIARLTNELHKERAHPDFEYETTQCGRKSGADTEPAGEGWEQNITDGDYHSSWERYDFHEDHFYRRRKSAVPETEVKL